MQKESIILYNASTDVDCLYLAYVQEIPLSLICFLTIQNQVSRVCSTVFIMYRLYFSIWIFFLKGGLYFYSLRIICSLVTGTNLHDDVFKWPTSNKLQEQNIIATW